MHAVMSRTNQEKSMIHLVWCLFFLEANSSISWWPGVENTLEDNLSSRFFLSFLSKAPSMDRAPTQVPGSLLRLLLEDSTWTYQRWMKDSSTVITAYLAQLNERTRRE